MVAAFVSTDSRNAALQAVKTVALSSFAAVRMALALEL
jgi:hypothetical protein